MSALERQLERFRKEQFQSLSTKPAEAKRAKEERKKAKAAEAAAYATVGTDVIAAVVRGRPAAFAARPPVCVAHTQTRSRSSRGWARP